MDDQILPLDLTIYGAIHQHEHEMHKKTGATPLNMIWQGMNAIKFRRYIYMLLLTAHTKLLHDLGRSENSDSDEE
jgi:hypothetical protein